ncbi:MAG: PQQ-binding-like beta-propeller repeat protein [Verrucomicrobia bacterium]|nr:PQQ-binding-like beta-propeller repeat protein [Verrucomicrobiota bacterium]
MRSLFLFLALSPSLAWSSPWPFWRGDVSGSGVTTETGLPVVWSKDKNVMWRVPLPEPGNSTPVVFGDRVFLTQPESATNWRGLYCLDRETGQLLWKNGVVYSKPESTHPTNPYCSSSPATDGKIVVAAYGSAGIAAYDYAGKELWRRDLGPVVHTWGTSSSPILHGNLVIHYHGPGTGARLMALDKATGATVWDYKEPTWNPGERTDGFKGQDGGVIGSFVTPILIRTQVREELVMSFPMEMKAFDPATGKEWWRCGGLNPLVYASPVATDDLVLTTGGYYGNSMAVRPGGSADVTRTHRLWQLVRHNGGIGTGVVKDGHYYYHNSGGIAYCLEMATGKTLWEERLPGAGKSWGSFLRTGELIYALSQAGDTVVFKANPKKLEVVAHNELGEETNASPVPSRGRIFLRTHEALWCVGTRP